MNTSIASLIILAALLAAVFLGMRIRRLLPAHHLNADTKDAVKLSMGLVATMSALVLGLLVSSAKGSYDLTRTEVIQMAAKVAFLDRVLATYGPEAATPRQEFHAAVQITVQQLWSRQSRSLKALASPITEGDMMFAAIQSLSPKDDRQRALKAQAASLGIELAQMRTLLAAQSVPSISATMLIIVVSWLVVIFLSFSLLAPPNATAGLSLTVAALSVSGAILLILELDQPLGGLIQVSREPMHNALLLMTK